MTRVSTYGNYQSALLDLMSAQSRMADAQQKVNTKKNATDLVGFGRGSETVSALMTSQTRIQTFIDTNKTHIFPVGVPGLFRTVYAPADYVETVNTMGQRLYAKQYEMPNGKGVNLDVQMNNLEYCTRPKVLIKGKRT